jgi:hypothetical protein
MKKEKNMEDKTKYMLIGIVIGIAIGMVIFYLLMTSGFMRPGGFGGFGDFRGQGNFTRPENLTNMRPP